MTLNNITYEIYRSLIFSGFMIGYGNNDRCQLADDVFQFVNVDTVYSTLKSNPGEQYFAVLGNWMPPYSTRFFEIITKNVIYTERYKEPQYIMGTIGRFYENLYIENVTLSNSQITGRPFY